jgi:TonB family protein
MSATAATVAALLVESTIELSLIAAMALAATWLLRKRSAALRHWILSAAVVSIAIAPPLGRVVPSWHLPIDAVSARATRGPLAQALGTIDEPRKPGAESPPAPATWADAASRDVGVLGIVAIVWAAGAAINLAVLLAGMCRLMRVRARAQAAVDPRWLAAAAEISRAYGLRRAVLLLQSDHPTLLVTWGTVRPKVILPRGAGQWTEDRIRVVLCHELAHVQRGDWLVQMAAELLRSIHWFNPLAWIVCTQLRNEGEQAADDAVLNVGIEGRDYAEHLLDVARAISRHGETWWPAPAIVRSSTLERRITAMLNTDVNRAPLTRTSRWVSVAALTVFAAAIASAQGALGTFSGAILDPMNRTLPNVTLVLTNVQSTAKHEVRSDSTGRFEVAGLPHGEYAIEAKLPGFATLKGSVRIAGQNVQQNLNLEIGSLMETVTVTPDGTPSKPPDPAQQRLQEERRLKREREALTCGDTSHGGNIRPPMKLTHVAPAYPLHLSQKNVGGTVQMQALIAKDGSIKDVRVVAPAHPDLDAAALAAIRQWRFDSTLLNCMPVEVNMKVTVNFKTT